MGTYDTSKVLVIDPVLVYSTYLGGSTSTTAPNDLGFAIAVDAAGNAYVTGSTESMSFPTVRPWQATCRSCNFDDVFVTKLNPDGSLFLYSTYLGGNSVDSGEGITVDTAGNVYVTGQTQSANFPTVNPFQTNPDTIFSDAFLTKIADPIGGVANLALTKMASPDPVPEGSPLTYTVTVTNNGPGR